LKSGASCCTPPEEDHLHTEENLGLCDEFAGRLNHKFKTLSFFPYSTCPLRVGTLQLYFAAAHPLSQRFTSLPARRQSTSLHSSKQPNSPRGVKHAALVIQHGQCRQCLNIVRVDGQHVAIYVVRVVCVSNRKQLPGNEAHLQRLFSLSASTRLHVRNQTVHATRRRHSRIFCPTSARLRCGMTLTVDGFAVSSVDRNRHWVIRGV